MSDFHEIRQCDLCEKPFVADEVWKRKCLLCWKEENSYGLGKSDKAFEMMRDAYVELEKELQSAKQEAVEASERAERAAGAYRKLRKLLDDERANGSKVRIAKREIDPERVRVLIKLCHPDKHGGSEAANEITKWLLGMRK